MKNFFTNYFSHIKSALDNVDTNKLKEAAELIKSASKSGNKIMIAGNGGSAAMASHVSVDLTKVAGIRAINFNEPDLLTCFANDYGYDKVFEKAIEFYGDKGDILILISSSGSSDNVINAAKYANQSDISVITFTGFMKDNPLCNQGKINFWLDSKAYNIVEMTHHIWLLSIADFIVGDIYYSAS